MNVVRTPARSYSKQPRPQPFFKGRKGPQLPREDYMDDANDILLFLLFKRLSKINNTLEEILKELREQGTVS